MKHIILVIIFGGVLISCSDFKANNQQKVKQQTTNLDMDTITLAAGCFWCVEAIFQDIKGVESVVSGYANGTVKNPSYKEVCTGRTGHAEVVQLVYDPQVVSLAKILEVFFQTHDPTTLNRQGGDVGTQYRSGIFYQTEAQKEIAVDVFNQLDDAGAFVNPIVTEITELLSFYPAEDYHQDYFDLNGEQPYCSAVVRPKVEKFKKAFSDILK
ncbi:MAG: peptide-methionine (S)-S-oxide reductase MsrA [Vicingaceae bacterium]|nr:peptide-methionine (S)-S-oxide reductase MsrA [Vicingaceae bacterium]